MKEGINAGASNNSQSRIRADDVEEGIIVDVERFGKGF